MRSSAQSAAALIVAIALSACGDGRQPAAVRAAADPVERPPRGAVADCSTQSEADFPGAYTDHRANVVVGPFALLGAGYTPPATVREFGGDKLHALVRPGHRVTVELPRRARRRAALAYGPFPQGEIELDDGRRVVTFIACDRDASDSTADGRPVTFWSGFVLAAEPHCVPLRIWVDEEPAPRALRLRMGVRRCP
jgi:hypothetical protein